MADVLNDDVTDVDPLDVAVVDADEDCDVVADELYDVLGVDVILDVALDD